MANFQLPKTKIYFKDGYLTKQGSNDSIVASFSAQDILGIRIESRKEYGPALFVGVVSISFAVVSKIYIASPGWSWVATIAWLTLTAVTFFMINTRNLVIETKSGKAEYPIKDNLEEAESFVLAMQHIIDSLSEAYIGGVFSHDELVFFRWLVAEAAHNDALFSDELKAVTGFNKNAVEELLKKLRELTS